ncbi:MAG: LysM peptidoglycan-binding domain-containing protein [Nitrospiraceae bacterium]|nr:LysM peptidoglycan-binding domain-containing protein [Nitrospiraceae bacterium]
MKARFPIPLFSVCLVLFFLVASTVEASVDYTVRKGDTLARIAKKYHVGMKELKRANTVSARHMKPGMKLVIPSAATTRKKARAERRKASTVDADKEAAETHEPAAPAPLPAAESIHHMVRKGDTLAAIARKYSIPVAELRELNNLKSSKLKIGRSLLVKRAGPKTYTVRKGDSLSKIAKKFGMEPDDLMELNELESPSVTAGQKLYLEQEVDPAVAAAYDQAAVKNVEEEIKKTEESEDFAERPMRDKLITFAKKLMNIPYKFGGNSLFGIDCSAYVKKVYGLLGIDLPRTAREQFKEGETVDRDDLTIGDLVFFRTYASFPSHVGIYLGNNLFIHASSKGKKVTINSLETPYYFKRFIGGKRLLSEDAAENTPNS